jgi:hypothetical protein
MYEFVLPRGQGTVVAATMDGQRVAAEELVRRGKALEKRFGGTVSFHEMPTRLQKAAAVQPVQ